MSQIAGGPSRRATWLALWVVYLVWGSTYLAIRVAVHPSHGAPVPPLILAGARILLAGLVMLVFTVRRPAPDGEPDPLGRKQWLAAAVIGLALPFGGLKPSPNPWLAEHYPAALLTMGLTAERVARHAPCLVLIIPPETVADRERLGWVVRA